MTAVGVTATRHGLTRYQRLWAYDTLQTLRSRGFDTLRHGDCVGGDAELAEMGRKMGFRLIAHPPTVPTFRAYIPSDIVLPALPYLERDRAMVDNSAYLLGCPKVWPDPGGRAGGTWYTIRYAHRRWRRWPRRNELRGLDLYMGTCMTVVPPEQGVGA
jgi:hypothetical protein